ncbi:KxYKxGKxW signal peptide domain-containing protein [Lentilactobacillus buchneri]|uniref:KxYKxGKxW signal peptide domain-containing protein n=1 Tax=Lentilactobacillus buchneri TaxID=1581 RepID=UPI001290AE7D|nr:KxYKxGKxW signal peptide domain-containing protein [Lentilactobacillus buchneri]MQN25544.1 LPXTG cell wall anchor domain-containing protein [Lentilactobacillus buchneri]
MKSSNRGIINQEDVTAKHYKMYKAGKRWMIAGLTVAAFGVGSQLSTVTDASADTTPTAQGNAGNSATATPELVKTTTSAPTAATTPAATQKPAAQPATATTTTADQTATPAPQTAQPAPAAETQQSTTAQTPKAQSESTTEPQSQPVNSGQTEAANPGTSQAAQQPAQATATPQAAQPTKAAETDTNQPAAKPSTSNNTTADKAAETKETGTKETETKAADTKAGETQAPESKTAEATPTPAQATTEPTVAEDLSYDQAVNVYNASKKLYGIITNQLDQAKNAYDQQLTVYKDKLAEYNQALEKYQVNQTQYSSEKAAYEKAKAEYEAAKTAYDQKKQDYDQTKALNDKAAADYRAAKDKVEAAVTTHTAQKTEYDSALAKYETARSAYEAARAQYEKGQGTSTDAQFKAIQDHYLQTKADYEKTEAEYQTVKTQYDAAQKQIDDLQPQFKDADQKQKATADQFKAIDAEYQKINQQYQQAHTTFANLEKQFTDAGIDFIAKTDAYNQLKADFDAVKAVHDRLAERYSVAQGAYDTLTTRLAELNDQYLIELKSYQEEMKVWDETYAKAMAFEKAVAESAPEKTANPILPGIQVTPTAKIVDVGDNGVFDLHFDANGIRTIYTNAEMVVNLPTDKGLSFDASDLAQYAIAGVTPVYDATTKTLTYHWDTLESGVAQDLHYVYGTEKGSVINGQTVTMGISFKADEISAPVTLSASQTMAMAYSAMVTNTPANVYTDSYGNEYKNPAQEDQAVWDFSVTIPTAQPKNALLEPGSDVNVYYYLAGEQTYVGMTKGTAENGLIDSAPEISTGQLKDGSPATVLKWTIKAGDVADQIAKDQTLKFQVIAKVNKDAANFQWLKTDVGVGFTFQGAQPINQLMDKIAATMVLPHDPTTWNVTGGSWKPMVHYGSKDGFGALADRDLLNPDPQVYSDANAVLEFYDALLPLFLFNDVDPEVPQNERLRDFNYYALHQSIDPREDLETVIIHNFVYLPSNSIKDSKTPSGVVGEWTYFKENPYLSLAVKYEGEGQNQYHTLFDNLPTITSDVEKDKDGNPIFATGGNDGSVGYIYINRQQLLAAGLDPTKNVVELYLYMHKKGMGDIPKNPDTISRESIYQYPDYPYKAYKNDTITITDKNGAQRTILKRDLLKSPEDGGLPVGSWAPHGTYGGVYFKTVVKSGATPGTIVHQMTPKVSWSNARTYVSLQDWVSDANAPEGLWRWLAKDEAEQQASIDEGSGWPGVVWQFLNPSTIEIAAPNKNASRYVTSAIFLDGKATGSVLETGAHQLTLGFVLDKSSLGNLVARDTPFETYTVLPKGVTFDAAASKQSGVIPFGNQYSVIDNFKGSGQQVLKIVWTDISNLTPGKNGATRVIVNIDKSAPKDMVFQNFINVGPDTENYIVSVPAINNATLSTTQKIADGSTTGLIDTKTPLITSGNYYILDKDSKLQSNQLVSQSDKGDYHHAVAVETGKQATVKITFTDNTDESLSQLDLLDFLPQAGSIEGVSTSDVRTSTYTAGLTGPVVLPADWTGKVNVYYTTEDQANLLKDLSAVTWQLENSVTDWSKITAFRIMLPGTSGQTINGRPAEGITFNLAVPDKSTFISKYAEAGKQVGVGELNDKLKDEVAYNSYVVGVNQMGYTEPLLAAIKVVNVDEKAKEPAQPILDETRPTNDAEQPVAPVAPVENNGTKVVDVTGPTAPEAGTTVVADYQPNLDQPQEPVAPVAPKKAENPVTPGGNVDPNKPITPTPSTPTPGTPTPTPNTPGTPNETNPTPQENVVHEDTTESQEPGMIKTGEKAPEAPKKQTAKDPQNSKEQLKVNDPGKVVANDAQAGQAKQATTQAVGQAATEKGTNEGRQAALPQTGDTETGQAVSIIGMILLAMFGWLGFGKKRKRE